MTGELPTWATDVLAASGRVEKGIACFPVTGDDASIAYYESVGGAHFAERAATPFAMTTLDTPVYHAYLRELADAEPDTVIVDVGGGDGRNATPWLEWGFRRVVLVDPILGALDRVRQRLERERPEWLERLLLVRADARTLPLRSACAGRVTAIEALAYLNEDYAQGLGECARVLRPRGRLLVADRDYEGALLARLFYYGGVPGMLDLAGGRDLVDGMGDARVRSRCFTADELETLVRGAGLAPSSVRGISGLSLVLGFLRSLERLGDVGTGDGRTAEVQALLGELARTGGFRRSHVVVAERPEEAS